jgi:tetratricopeptide (TPR) repeat protein
VRAHLGHTDESVATLTAEIARNQHNAETSAYCLQTRAQVARDINDAKTALTFALEAQRRFDEAGSQSPRDKAVLLGDIGYIYSLLGDSQRAQTYYEQSLAMFSSAGRAESADAMATLIGWGAVNGNIGNPSRALAIWDEALAIAKRRSPTGEGPPVLLLNHAVALGLVGRYEDAIAAFDSAGQVAHHAGTAEYQASAMSNKADILRELGRLDEAETLLDQADTKLHEGNVPPTSPVALRQKLFHGRLAAARGRFAEATTSFTDVVDTYTRIQCCDGAISRALVARAEVSLAAHMYGPALADAEHALERAQHAQGAAPFSNFTGAAWLAIARIRAAQGHSAAAHDAYALAARNLGPTLGEQHRDTLDAKAH